MKKLELNQMENLEGGKGCGKAGAVLSIAAGVVGLALFAAPAASIFTLAGGFSLLGGIGTGFSLSSAVAGVGCGIADLL